MPTINDSFRIAINAAYQEFLNYARPNWSGWQRYPIEMFDTLVADGFIQPADGWRKQMGEAKIFLIGIQQRLYAVTQMGRGNDPVTLKISLSKIQNNIEAYRDGRREAEIELCAKQWVVIEFFKVCRKGQQKAIYQLVES